jgi:hypothetical protein
LGPGPTFGFEKSGWHESEEDLNMEIEKELESE